jgi:hypothetical protein
MYRFTMVVLVCLGIVGSPCLVWLSTQWLVEFLSFNWHWTCEISLGESVRRDKRQEEESTEEPKKKGVLNDLSPDPGSNGDSCLVKKWWNQTAQVHTVCNRVVGYFVSGLNLWKRNCDVDLSDVRFFMLNVDVEPSLQRIPRRRRAEGQKLFLEKKNATFSVYHPTPNRTGDFCLISKIST